MTITTVNTTTQRWVAESTTGSASRLQNGLENLGQTETLDATIADAIADLRAHAAAMAPAPTRHAAWDGDQGQDTYERTYTVTVPEYVLTVEATHMGGYTVLYTVTATGTPVLSYTERIVASDHYED